MIVPFRCGGCGREFSPEAGGICSRCQETYCLSCLFLEIDKEKQEDAFCEKCKNPDKKYVRVRMSFPSINRWRKKNKKHQTDK